MVLLVVGRRAKVNASVLAGTHLGGPGARLRLVFFCGGSGGSIVLLSANGGSHAKADPDENDVQKARNHDSYFKLSFDPHPDFVPSVRDSNSDGRHPGLTSWAN